MTTLEPNLDRVAQFVVDLAGSADGQKDGTVSAANFTRVLNVLDRLDTPLSPRQQGDLEAFMVRGDASTTIDQIRGNGWIDTAALSTLLAGSAGETDQVSLGSEAAALALNDLNANLALNLPKADDNYGLRTEASAMISERFIRNYAKDKVTFVK